MSGYCSVLLVSTSAPYIARNVDSLDEPEFAQPQGERHLKEM